MQSFRLSRGGLPESLIALPIAAICCYWLLRVRGIDLGENDFPGLLYLLSSIFLVLLAMGFSLAAIACGTIDLIKGSSRAKAVLGLVAGVASLILVMVGLWG